MPRPPTGEERDRWRPMAEALFRRLRQAEERNAAHLGAEERRARLAAFAAAVDAARAWMDAGFPEHPVFGIRDWPGGGGGDLCLIDWPTTSASWTAQD